MKCNLCGEEVNFVLIRVTARWVNETNDWIPEVDSAEEPMCNTCNSFDVEFKEDEEAFE